MSSAPDPGAGFQAATGIYLGALVSGTLSLGMAIGDASSGVFFSVITTVFTLGLVVGALAAWWRSGLADRLGEQRWRLVLTGSPTVAIAGLAWLLFATGAAASEWYLVPLAVTVSVALAAGWVLTAMARETHLESIIDEPAVRWEWQRVGVDVAAVGIGVAFLAVGLGLWTTTGRTSIMFVVVAVAFILQGLSPLFVAGDSPWASTALFYNPEAFDRSHHEIQATEVGLILEPMMKPSYKKRIPWSQITDIQLTEDELRLKRGWRPAIRCDRTVIDDADDVVTTVQTSLEEEWTQDRESTAVLE
ncbi:hypothetical protein G6M89_04080 [Natronolimnobius sp. AArcel1]|uniref:hypothetical protein n=1 Tax=Natronolimnobius sp. AArcel1 TaxID=1679093 RepID=UPI0013EA1F8C|nr:hypothetical protein [Natronolimnobius sp. AArcel1]NGM68196.1 hypothetical protein [Natronolimnobius sp. AArcel1]